MNAGTGTGEATSGTSEVPPASTRRGVLAAVAALLAGSAGGLRGDVRVAAEEAGLIPGPGEEWDAEIEGGRVRRRTKVCRAQVGDEFLECRARCRKKERMKSGGCLFVSGEAMNIVQNAPLNRRRRWGCQWTSFPGEGILEPSAYRAVVLCRKPRRKR